MAALVTSVSPEVAALLKSKGYQQAAWNNGAWYDPNDPDGAYLSEQTLAKLTGSTGAPVAGAVLDRETGAWTLNGQPVSLKNAQGQVWINNETPGSKGGQLTGTGYWATPTGGGGGFLGSLLGGAANAFSSVASPIVDLGPAAPLAIIGGGLAANAGLLGGASATGAGATSGAAGDFALTAPGVGLPSAATGLAAPTGTGLMAGGGEGLLAPGASTIGSGVSTSLAANAIAPTLGVTGLMSGEAAGAAGGSAATTAAGAAGAGTVAKELIPGVPNGVVGAALGALGSGDKSTTTTADKSPWAPAQEWMKANLARGQQLQQQYQNNPFSAFQQQAYNNQAGLGNSFRGAVNGLTQQMNAFRPYQRTPQSQVASPYQFTNPNLGFTSKPFGSV